MRGRKWKKWVTLAAVTGMLVSQIGTMPTWAAQEQDVNTVMETVEESADGEELIESEEADEVVEEELIESEEADEVVEEELIESEEADAVEEETAEAEETVTGETQEETDAASEGHTKIKESETPEGLEESIEDSDASTEAADIVAADELADPEEDITDLSEGITWTVDGDTVIITGEGEFGVSGLKDAIRSARHVRFENCKIIGSMAKAFYDMSNLESIDLTGLDTSQVTDMSWMFYSCSKLTSLDVSNWDTSQVTDMKYMFYGCYKLTSPDVSNWDTSQVTNMEYMFEACNELTNLDVSSWDTSQVTSMEYMFAGCNFTSLDVSSWDTSQVRNMGWMFGDCWNLTSLDVSNFNTSQVVYMYGMFGSCSKLTSLDVSNWDTSQVFHMAYMFMDCSKLAGLDVSNFNTSSVNWMNCMFYGCSSLTNLDLSNFDTSKVRDMSYMFTGCSNLTNLDLSSFDTSRVTDMTRMFKDCKKLKSLNMSSFDMSNFSSVSDEYGSMFTNCQLKELRTPKAMSADCTIELNGVFCDPAGTETDVLTTDFLSTVLIFVRNLPAPDPAKFAVVGTIGGRNVTFSSDTEDAVIYYSSKTSNLTTWDACVQNGETVLFENFYGTIYARTYANGQWGNVSRLILKIPVVNKPVISSSNNVVTIKTSTPNSTIYYTTDGSTPSPTNGKRLTNSAGSFTVSANCTVKAIAVRSCFTNSEIASTAVTAKKLGAPSFAVKGVIGGRAVTFNTTEAQGEIYYSFTTSNITTKDLHVQPGETVLFENYYGTVYAKTYVNGQWSNVSRLILKIPVVNTPTITDAGDGRVKISTSTPSCTIYYTTDGSTPSPTHGTRINSSSSIITVGSGKTVKAIAVRSCFTNSEVATYKR